MYVMDSYTIMCNDIYSVKFCEFLFLECILFTALIYVVLYSVGSWFFSMNDYEKDVIRVPINNLLNKLKSERRN